MIWRRRAVAAEQGNMVGGLELLARIGAIPATIADVGASDGRWAKCAQAVFPEAELVLFEPQPVHAEGLDRFQAKNPGATIIRSAVGPSEGTTLFHAGDPMGGALQKERTAESIEVPMGTLDGALADSKPPFLVKLDTHGVEGSILAGAQATLARSVAWIIEAYAHRFQPDSLLFWELCSYMAEHGFRPVNVVDVLRRPEDGSLWQMDIFFIRSDWSGFEHLNYG